MAKSQADTVKEPNVQIVQEQENLVDVSNFIEGFISDIDPAVLLDNALLSASNVEFLRGMLLRRNGLLQYSNTKPNSNKVLNILAFYQTTTGLNLLRFDRAKIYRALSSGWTEFTPNPAPIALTGTDTDYFNLTAIDDRAFFSNNGVDPIRELDPAANNYIALGNAPRYKYICAAFDKIVGANRVAAVDIPTEFGWSGNLNYDEWDPLVDISAGTNNLVASPSGLNDDITGCFFNESVLILPRQRSIWIATHVDSGTNPFNPISKVPRIGADLPRTILLTDQGLIWTSFQNSAIYAWDLDNLQSTPIVLTSKITRYLKNLLQNSSEIWASYSSDTKKYSLFMYDGSSAITCITYDFNYKNFVVHDYPLVSTVQDLDFSASSTTIDELVGTIAGLIGTIDALGGLLTDTTRFFGHSDGRMSTYSFYSGLESTSLITSTDLSASFINDIRSKIFELNPFNQSVNLVRFKFTPYNTGTLYLYHSKDDGLTWSLDKTYVVTTAMLNKANNMQIRKNISAERLIWRLTSSDVMMAHNGLNVKVLKTGVAKNGS